MIKLVTISSTAMIALSMLIPASALAQVKDGGVNSGDMCSVLSIENGESVGVAVKDSDNFLPTTYQVVECGQDYVSLRNSDGTMLELPIDSAFTTFKLMRN